MKSQSKIIITTAEIFTSHILYALMVSGVDKCTARPTEHGDALEVIVKKDDCFKAITYKNIDEKNNTMQALCGKPGDEEQCKEQNKN